jgi:hypothetical protein
LRLPRLIVPIAPAAGLVILIACGGGGDDASGGTPTPDIHTPVDAAYLPLAISSDLAVGENRFAMGLLDEDGLPVSNASLHFAFITPDGTAGPEADATAITSPLSGSGESAIGEVGIYVANVEFDAAGQWKVAVSGALDDGQPLEEVTVDFPVRETSLSPAVGAPAPRSVQTLLSDVSDISEIDTSVQPIPEQHTMTIADAVTSGRPTVVIFATPAFCTSAICGPTKDIVDTLYPEYSDRVNFVHVEPYDVARARAGQCAPDFSDCIIPLITNEWGLRTEPWVFVVGPDGNIAAKFEGVVSAAELEAALEGLAD